MSPVIGSLASASSRGYGMFGATAVWAPGPAYDALATTTLSATTSSITFAGIPSGYKHLQIRYIARTDMSSGGAWSPINVRFNSDTAANYTVHTLGGQGASAFSEGYTSQTGMTGGFGAASTNATNSFGAGVIDILDYASTTKNKTIRILNGVENNGSGIAVLQSGSWMSTSAINSITLGLYGSTNGSNYLANTQFALYGVK